MFLDENNVLLNLASIPFGGNAVPAKGSSTIAASPVIEDINSFSTSPLSQVLLWNWKILNWRFRVYKPSQLILHSIIGLKYDFYTFLYFYTITFKGLILKDLPFVESQGKTQFKLGRSSSSTDDSDRATTRHPSGSSRSDANSPKASNSFPQRNARQVLAINFVLLLQSIFSFKFEIILFRLLRCWCLTRILRRTNQKANSCPRFQRMVSFVNFLSNN